MVDSPEVVKVDEGEVRVCNRLRMSPGGWCAEVERRLIEGFGRNEGNDESMPVFSRLKFRPETSAKASSTGKKGSRDGSLRAAIARSSAAPAIQVSWGAISFRYVIRIS